MATHNICGCCTNFHSGFRYRREFESTLWINSATLM